MRLFEGDSLDEFAESEEESGEEEVDEEGEDEEDDNDDDEEDEEECFFLANEITSFKKTKPRTEPTTYWRVRWSRTRSKYEPRGELSKEAAVTLRVIAQAVSWWSSLYRKRKITTV